MKCDFTFSANNYCWCVIIDLIFSDTCAKQWPSFELIVTLDKIEIKITVS